VRRQRLSLYTHLETGTAGRAEVRQSRKRSVFCGARRTRAGARPIRAGGTHPTRSAKNAALAALFDPAGSEMCIKCSLCRRTPHGPVPLLRVPPTAKLALMPSRGSVTGATQTSGLCWLPQDAGSALRINCRSDPGTAQAPQVRAFSPRRWVPTPICTPSNQR